MKTATASAAAPRMLLRNNTERGLACSAANLSVASKTAGRYQRSSCASSTSEVGLPPVARSALLPIWRAEYDSARIRNVGSTAADSSSSSRIGGASAMRRASASETASRACSSRSRSGHPSRPSSRAALSRNTATVAANTSRFSSRQRSSRGSESPGPNTKD